MKECRRQRTCTVLGSRVRTGARREGDKKNQPARYRWTDKRGRLFPWKVRGIKSSCPPRIMVTGRASRGEGEEEGVKRKAEHRCHLPQGKKKRVGMGRARKHGSAVGIDF